jgi:hypothetical protein
VLTNLAGVFGETDAMTAQASRPFLQPARYRCGARRIGGGDSGNHLIRFVTLDGTVSTIAGSTFGFRDGAGTVAQFNAPAGLAADVTETFTWLTWRTIGSQD